MSDLASELDGAPPASRTPETSSAVLEPWTQAAGEAQAASEARAATLTAQGAASKPQDESKPRDGAAACAPNEQPRMVAGDIQIRPLWLRFRRPKTESLYLLSSLWSTSCSGVSWHFFDVVASLLSILGFAAIAPAAAWKHFPCGLFCLVGVLVLTYCRQLLRLQFVKGVMGAYSLRLSDAQWAILAKSSLSSALITLVSAWSSCLGLIHLPAAALIVVALSVIDINAHAFDPLFTMAMALAANLLHFGLFATRGKYTPFAAQGVDGVHSAVEVLAVLPAMMVFFQAQVGPFLYSIAH